MGSRGVKKSRLWRGHWSGARNPVDYCRRKFGNSHCELRAEIPMEGFRDRIKSTCEVLVSRVTAAGRMAWNLVTAFPSSLYPGVRPAQRVTARGSGG